MCSTTAGASRRSTLGQTQGECGLARGPCHASTDHHTTIARRLPRHAPGGHRRALEAGVRAEGRPLAEVGVAERKKSGGHPRDARRFVAALDAVALVLAPAAGLIVQLKGGAPGGEVSVPETAVAPYTPRVAE